MDIRKLAELTADEEQGAVVPIFQKNNEPLLAADGTQCTITVLGSDSMRYRAEDRAISRAILRSRKPTLEPETLTANAIRLASAVVVGMHGFEIDGTSADCTPENVRAVLKHSWIMAQVEAGIRGHADFFAASSSPSLTTSAGTPSSDRS